jgi:hypothetical protein
MSTPTPYNPGQVLTAAELNGSFNGKVDADNAAITGGYAQGLTYLYITGTANSVSPTTGALVVAGGAGIGGNVQIGGSQTITGNTNVLSTQASNNPTTGALVVTGGVGVGGSLNVAGSGSVAGSYSVAGQLQANQTTDSTVVGNGAAIVAGGLSVAKTLNVGTNANVIGDLVVSGNQTVSGTLSTKGVVVLSGGTGIQFADGTVQTTAYELASPVSVAQGGTGAITGNGALQNLGGAYIQANPNLLANGSAEFGAAGWSLQTTYSALTDSNGGYGTYFGNPSALSAQGAANTSQFIPVGASQPLVLSLEFNSSGVTAGTVNITLACYNSSGAFISNAIQINIPNGTGNKRYAAAGTTPAATASARVFVNFSGVTASAFGAIFRKVKVESGTVATQYTQEPDWPFLFSTSQTFNAQLNVSYPGAELAVNETSGTSKGFVQFQKSGVAAWNLGNSSSANTLAVDRFNSSGVYVDSPISIAQATGVTSFTQRPVFNGNIPWDSGNLPSAAISGRLLAVRVFSASGSYTPTTNTASAIVYAWAGGGAGGSATVTGSTATSTNGNGGNGGNGCVWNWPSPTAQTITVGVGGTPVSGAAGGNGGNTTIGSLLTVYGGIGGLASTNASPNFNYVGINTGNTGTTTTTGTLLVNCTGGDGQSLSSLGVGFVGSTCAGGTSMFGPSGPRAGLSAWSNSSGTAPAQLVVGRPSSATAATSGLFGWGCGGGGGSVVTTTGTAIGGYGSNGYVVIFEYA